MKWRGTDKTLQKFSCIGGKKKRTAKGHEFIIFKEETKPSKCVAMLKDKGKEQGRVEDSGEKVDNW